jgi:hypothetical protein
VEDGRVERPEGAADTVAGLMAAGSIFVSAIGLVHTPVKLLPASMLLALIAAGIGGRHRRLAAFAVAVAFVCWIAGMTIAIATERDLY